jgi:hypothetical protein
LAAVREAEDSESAKGYGAFRKTMLWSLIGIEKGVLSSCKGNICMSQIAEGSALQS